MGIRCQHKAQQPIEENVSIRLQLHFRCRLRRAQLRALRAEAVLIRNHHSASLRPDFLAADIQ